MHTTTVRNHPERVMFDAKYIFQFSEKTASLFIKLRARHWDDPTVRELEIARYLAFYKGSYPEESEASKEMFKLLCDRLEQLSGQDSKTLQTGQ